MKRSFLIYAVIALGTGLGLTVLAGSFAHADCRYFKTKTRVESCKGVQLKPEELPVQEPPAEADPLMTDPGAGRSAPDDGRRVRLQCACEYSLSGSDPRCDLDHEELMEVRLLESNPRVACRTAKARCRDLCPTTWP